MKISAVSLSGITPGKVNIKDSRLDQMQDIVKAKKVTYVQVEMVSEQEAKDADVILVAKESRLNLILEDLEFVETRLSRSEEAAEKELLTKLKSLLEKEELASSEVYNDEDKKRMVVYGLLTYKPVVVATQEEAADKVTLLARALKESGYTSFFTVAGEKEARAWLIRKGVSAWEAAGVVHSDIQKGFIRAEIIKFDDYIKCGGESQAKQAGLMRLEGKEYVIQDGDLANFRFNK